MRKSILIAAALIATVSCQKIAESPLQPDDCITFTAGFVTTKADFSAGKITWTAGDKIAVCGNGKVEVVTLTADDITNDGETATIKTTTISAVYGIKYTAVFPAACAYTTFEDYIKSNAIQITPGSDAGGPDCTFKSYASTMLVESVPGYEAPTPTFTFHNVGAVICVATENSKIAKFVFSSNDETVIKSDISVTLGTNGNPDVIAPVSTNTGNSVSYTMDESGIAYIPVNAATLANGYTLTAYDSDNNFVGRVSSTKSITLQNNKYYTISNFDEKSTRAQLWENGPYWALANVGAKAPEEIGYYFAWGYTEGLVRNSNKWVLASDGTTEKQFSSAYYPNRTDAQFADAATAAMGSDWRIPTADEFKALVENCDKAFVTLGGTAGWKFTGKNTYSDKSIFIPVAGNAYSTYLDYVGKTGSYWSRDTGTGAGVAAELSVSDGAVSVGFGRSKYNGANIRAVSLTMGSSRFETFSEVDFEL